MEGDRECVGEQQSFGAQEVAHPHPECGAMERCNGRFTGGVWSFQRCGGDISGPADVSLVEQRQPTRRCRTERGWCNMCSTATVTRRLTAPEKGPHFSSASR
jgi:hypothetical protein